MQKLPFSVDARAYLDAMADTLSAYAKQQMTMTPEDMYGVANELREIARTLAPAQSAHVKRVGAGAPYDLANVIAFPSPR